MQPTKKTIADLFEDRSQYLIPLFQRGYVWTLEKQIARLWDDVVDRVDAMREHAADSKAVGSGTKLKKLRKHFLGAIIVGSETEDGDAVPKREVIDGQQRLTTLQILLLAFRDAVKGLDASIDDDLHSLTSNRGTYRDKNDRLKVWPTNVGRDVMSSLYEAGGMKALAAMYPVKARDGLKFERPPMTQAYLYFSAIIGAYVRGKRHDEPLRESDAADTEQTVSHAILRSIAKDNDVIAPFHDTAVDLSRVRDLKRALEKQFQIMRLQLDDEDDPQIIFETLNALGEPLTPSDLIRNYLFLRASRASLDVDHLYHLYWRDFDEKPDETTAKKGAKFWKVAERQGRLNSPRLDLFFFHYVGLRLKESSKVAHLFQDFKEWWEAGEPRNFERELERVQSLSRRFQTVIAPGQSTRFDLFCRRLKLLDTSTHTPLVLHLLERLPPDHDDFIAAITDIESYFVRRFVCGLSTNAYNRIFLDRILRDLSDSHAPAADLRALLLGLIGPSQRWPDDREFEVAWQNRRLYQGSNTRRVRAVLEGLEHGLHSHKTDKGFFLDDLSVEHILPQKWRTHYDLADQSPQAAEERERLLHSIGNLTLVTSAFNSGLSNEPFIVKRPELAQNSGLALNSYFQDVSPSIWSEVEIRTRADELFRTATRVWPHPA